MLDDADRALSMLHLSAATDAGSTFSDASFVTSLVTYLPHLPLDTSSNNVVSRAEIQKPLPRYR